MAKYRDRLPQLDGGIFLTDGGIETTLIFDRGLDLPQFAAFDLLAKQGGADELRDYYRPYAELARERGLGFVAESPTWRASSRWGAEIGYDDADLDRLNREAIELMVELRERYEADASPVVISGCIGPQDDGYKPSAFMTVEAARDYHSTQIATFAGTEADMVAAITMTYVEEATGLAQAASDAGMPVAISFTVETDGSLPSGQPLGEAIGQVEAEAGKAPAYFMINCAHPTHFEQTLESGDGWQSQIWGLRANSSAKSHAELDEASELDRGDAQDLARRYARLRDGSLPNLRVLGGCCGTDHRHIGEICEATRAGA